MEQVPICDEDHEVCENGGVCVILSDPRFNFCKCTPEFAGAKCHGRVDDTDSISICSEDDDCQNNGKCVKASEIIEGKNIPANYCQCPQGFTGNYCHGTGQFEKSQLQEAAEAAAEESFAEGEMQDQAAPPDVPTPSDTTEECLVGGNKCENGSKCILKDEANGIPENHCECVDGFFGALCKGKHSEECLVGGNKCENGSTCILKDEANGIPENHCECVDGFFGALCKGKHTATPPPTSTPPPAAKKKICTPDGNQCENGSTCVEKDEANGIPENHCQCVNGYFGEYCRGKHSHPESGSSADEDTPSEAFSNEFNDPGDDPLSNSPGDDPLSNSSKDASVCSILGNQCLNGGVCVKGTNQVDGSSKDYCNCPEGTSGLFCQTKGVCNLTCQHGGSCRHFEDVSHANDGDTAFECECVGDYKGVECEIPFQRCPITSDGKQMECLYGGTCVFREEENEYGCACTKGRSGDYCEKGTVSSMEDYNGDCYEDQDCLNGGICVRTHDAETTAETDMLTKQTKCLCALGWGGDNCEARCTSLNCQHGSTCRFNGEEDITHDNESGEAGAYCDCPSGYKGLECEIEVQKCPGDNDMECLYGGQCIGSDEDADGNFYNCACPPGRIGVHCEQRDPLYNPKAVPADKPGGYVTPAITTQASRKELDKNILTVGIVSLIFLLMVPCTIFCLGRHRRKKAAAKAVDENTEQAPVQENGNGEKANGAHSEDIFDYNAEGVVNINLDENEPVQLPKDKEIV